MDTKSFYLRRPPASEGILTGVGLKGEFHENAQPASGVLLTGVTPTREIHLKKQCASEGLLKGVSPKGEFHESLRRVSSALNLHQRDLKRVMRRRDRI